MTIAAIGGFFRKYWRTIAIEVVINGVLPYAIYSYFQIPLGDVKALLASSVPPVLWSVVEFIRSRRVDAISLFVIIGIVLSLLAFIGGGSVKFLQLRENLVSALIGVAFLVSAAVGKPLIYQLARATMARKSDADRERFEELQKYGGFRSSMMLMTLVWGFGLLAQAAAACVLVFALSIKQYLLVSPILGNASIGALGLWTWWYSRSQQRAGRKRLASGSLGSADAE